MIDAACIVCIPVFITVMLDFLTDSTSCGFLLNFVLTSYIVTSIDQVFLLFHKIGRKRDSLLLQNLNTGSGSHPA
jgi:hypothetical protein